MANNIALVRMKYNENISPLDPYASPPSKGSNKKANIIRMIAYIILRMLNIIWVFVIVRVFVVILFLLLLVGLLFLSYENERSEVVFDFIELNKCTMWGANIFAKMTIGIENNRIMIPAVIMIAKMPGFSAVGFVSENIIDSMKNKKIAKIA